MPSLSLSTGRVQQIGGGGANGPVGPTLTDNRGRRGRVSVTAVVIGVVGLVGFLLVVIMFMGNDNQVYWATTLRPTQTYV